MEDEESFKCQAVKVLQDLTSFHLSKGSKEELIQIELKRLRLMRQYSFDSEKDIRFYKALKSLNDKYEGNEEVAWVQYEMALYLIQTGSKYQPLEGTEYKLNYIEAKELLKAIRSKYPDALVVDNVESQLLQLNQKSLNVQMERVNEPENPMRALVDYRNLSQVYVKVVALDAEFIKNSNRRNLSQKEQLEAYLKRKTALSWVQELPIDGDHQKHSVEIKVDALPLGAYALLLSDNEKFTFNKNGVAINTFWISNMSSLIRNYDNGSSSILVVDRMTGQPIENIKATVYREEYDYKTRIYNWFVDETYITNEDGIAIVPFKNRRHNYKLSFKKDDDFLILDDRFYQYQSRSEFKPFYSTHFFTDRSIYRPGQTIHFKGLVLYHTSEKRKEIAKSKSVDVQLMDVNWQEVEKLKLMSNEFGTISGTFVTPTSGLTGSFTLQTPFGSQTISVEEYKRPKFHVEFEPVTNSYVVDEDISVTGLAQAYAGFNLDGADVTYRVVREANFPNYWWFKWYRPSYQSETQEIVNGSTVTDDQGNFDISFKAIADKKVKRENEPTFRYTIYADVTDINGETRSGQTVVNVGYVGLNLVIRFPERMSQDSVHTILIDSKNKNGEDVPAKGMLKIYELIEEGRVLRSRLWKQPDFAFDDKRSVCEVVPE